MKQGVGSMLAILAKVELAGALAAAATLGRSATLTLRYGESVAGYFLAPSLRQGDEYGLAADESLLGYGSYVREMAALPMLAGLTFLDQLDRLRV